MPDVPRQQVFYAVRNSCSYVNRISLSVGSWHDALADQKLRQAANVLIEWEFNNADRKRERILCFA